MLSGYVSHMPVVPFVLSRKETHVKYLQVTYAEQLPVLPEGGAHLVTVSTGWRDGNRS